MIGSTSLIRLDTTIIAEIHALTGSPGSYSGNNHNLYRIAPDCKPD